MEKDNINLKIDGVDCVSGDILFGVDCVSGDIIFDTNNNCHLIYNGSQNIMWSHVAAASNINPVTSNYSVDEIIDLYGAEKLENALRKRKLERITNVTNL